MITTLTLNPCIDKTLLVEDFSIEKTNRAEVLRVDLGGKGINVSRALTALGAKTLCTGFDFSAGEGSFLRRSLAQLGLEERFLTVPGELRMCTKIFDPKSNTMVEVNERGCSVERKHQEQLLRLLADLAPNSQFLVLSGSLPRGMSGDFYAEVMRAVAQVAPTCRVVVDAVGESLTAALTHRPFLIKPNEEEFAATFGTSTERFAISEKCEELIAAGAAENICVSLGRRGAIFACGEGAYFCPSASVPVRSLQAAGDSMVAGICLAFSLGLGAAHALAYGTAAAAGTVSRPGTEVVTRADFDAILKDVQVMKIR